LGLGIGVMVVVLLNSLLSAKIPNWLWGLLFWDFNFPFGLVRNYSSFTRPSWSLLGLKEVYP